MSSKVHGAATENLSISMPGWLIEEIDRYCVKSELSRSAVITRATLRYLLLKMDSPEFWERLLHEDEKSSC